MLHFSRWKIVVILLTVLGGLIAVTPNFLSRETLDRLPSWMPKRQMPLGLDLQGGAHLLLAMDADDLKRTWLLAIQSDVRRVLREAKLNFTGLGQAGGVVVVRPADPKDNDAVLRELRKIPQQVGNALLGTAGADIDVRTTADGGMQLVPTDVGIQNRISGAASAAIETLNRRVNNLGTAESTIVRQGRDRILLQFPGLSDTTLLKQLVGQTAKLTFHDVNAQMTAADAKAAGRIPSGYRVYPSAEREGEEYLLRDAPIIDGVDLVDAQPGFDQRTNEPIISFRFNQAGARKFGRFTQENVGRPFAIVLDDKVLSAPVIREPILGGTGQISGSFTVETANTLAVQLRSGALPAKLTIVEERTVGPSLGADSIEAGRLAGIIGAIATVILTVIAYGTFGIFAVVGLVVHLLMTVALMTLAGSTLTLPGIAGLVLGVAMAVDANVLIYERIREELRNGKPPISAIDTGFQRAFITIADSQLTTLACAVVMFWLGSGPIRGFAVTLVFGILTSIFASVTVVRLLISWWLRANTKSRRTVEVPV
ncbi:MAG TPA: protein translocase subunit SecD [Hyphomicrobiaceae bacterium]|nr:protein translocase subunit SecD [Hyphomicrobiaceae bacterium]